MTDETLGKMWNILKKNDFQIDVAVKSEIICTSCKNILIKPYNVPCGCRYCHDCLISYLNGEDKFCLGESDFCKIVLISIDKNVFPDQVASIKILKIIVKCSLESCEFKTELGKMADHMRTCNRQQYPYYTIGCDENEIDVEKMKQHLKQKNYGDARLLMDFVDYWGNEMKLLKTNMLELQYDNKYTMEQMDSNQKTILAMEDNLAKLLQKNRSLKQLKTEKSHQNNQIEEIILAMQMKSVEQNQGIKANTEKIEDLKQRFDGQFTQIEMNQEQIKIRIDKMSQENADIPTQSKQIETKLTQANQNCGEFLWCIQNWGEKLERAYRGIDPEYFSDPFYSHKNGYKMCLKLVPNDYNHLYFGICIMRGEFDNILQWPFRHGVKLDLLNQKTGRAQVSRNVCYEQGPSHDAWKKATSERNIGDGYQFIALSELPLNADLCQGDQLWIKATPLMKP